jgi:predicted extracellular nuclease
VTCDLTAIGGSTSQAFFDDGTNGDLIAADNTFSYATTITAGTTGGAKSADCTIGDAQSRTGAATVGLTVLAIVPIGTVNGPVLSTDAGTSHRSPYAPASGNASGQTVTIQGVIYEKTLQAVSNSTNTYKGFFVQNTAATADTEPNTSDGLFVFMSSYGDIKNLSGGYYAPQVGDEVVVSGKISEYYNMTELTSPMLVKPLVRSGVEIAAEVPPVVANPPVALADANRYWERLQGMRVQVPQNSVVLGGRGVFSPADAEIWVAAPDSTIAQRADPYARRAFRDAHPLDDNYNPSSWDGNGYRILMGSLGIKGAAGDAQALIDPARTFDTVTNAPAGGLNYTFSKYRIEISAQPTFSEGVDPAADNPAQVIDRSLQYSIVDYNLENLYDYRDNPFSGCDFTGNGGCSNAGTPFLARINPPYDYVPASDAAYQARLTDIATQIVSDLHSPDILMVQEVENQDICRVTAGALACGTTDNADGKPDVLQELALKVASLGGPAYDAAFDRDSSDLRGIAPAYLYRTDRVQLLPPAGDPVLGGSPAITGYAAVPYDGDISNPKTLNAVLPTGVTACETSWVFPRAPDVALFRIWSSSIGVGTGTDVYTINNHFKSGPDSCVPHRTEQAKYNAALVAYIEAAKPDARIVVGGDLNVYPRPDDIAYRASDQLGSLYEPSLGLTNLWDVLLGQAPAAAYSYVYLGQAQTLDQMFVNRAMGASLDEFRIAHINSDFPADYTGDVARGTSDHDPNVGAFTLQFPFIGFFNPVKPAPALNAVKAGQTVPLKFNLGGDRGLAIFAGGPTVTPVACSTGTPTGSGVAAVGKLRYDVTSGQYIYTWQTDKSSAESCTKLSFLLVDGTSHAAYFDFRK